MCITAKEFSLSVIKLEAGDKFTPQGKQSKNEYLKCSESHEKISKRDEREDINFQIGSVQRRLSKWERAKREINKIHEFDKEWEIERESSSCLLILARTHDYSDKLHAQ